MIASSSRIFKWKARWRLRTTLLEMKKSINCLAKGNRESNRSESNVLSYKLNDCTALIYGGTVSQEISAIKNKFYISFFPSATLPANFNIWFVGSRLLNFNKLDNFYIFTSVEFSGVFFCSLFLVLAKNKEEEVIKPPPSFYRH
ncbi:hypothetical protein [Anaerofustis stercorihominis]|uniref:hypothetical protein n=1 Tax=Anaerofustis stercorihominis TaxID=214853 RepID=UPI0039840FD8